jgi:hypothetical protein
MMPTGSNAARTLPCSEPESGTAENAFHEVESGRESKINAAPFVADRNAPIASRAKLFAAHRS